MKKYSLALLLIIFLQSIAPSLAYLGTVDGYLVPETKNVTVGEVFTAKVMLKTGSQKISVVNIKLNVDPAKLKVKSAVMNSGKFNNVFLETYSNGLVSLFGGVTATTTADLPSGDIEFATIIFEGIANGSVDVTLASGWEVTGPGVNNDYSYDLKWKNATYVVSTVAVVEPTTIPTAIPTPNGVDLVLSYKVSLANVNPSSAQCVGNLTFKIMAVANGQTKTYTDVFPQTKTVVGNKLVFGGSLNLVGFNETQDVSVFVVGPKQIQMKYGENNQSSAFNQAIGKLTLAKVNSPIYDFSNYPLIAGDVVSNNSLTSQDGLVNGVDFAYIKSKSMIHETVATNLIGKPEGTLRGDLNGDCQVNSNDVNIMKISLQDKQGQLY